MASRVSSRLMAVLVDLFPFLDPFVLPFVSLYLCRELTRWKDRALSQITVDASGGAESSIMKSRSTRS
jgi:hypothetical protein